MKKKVEKVTKKYVRREDAHCTRYADYLRVNNLPFMRIACEIPTNRMSVIYRMKREGFRAGYADYMVYKPYYENGVIKFPGLFVEMKHEGGSMPTMNGSNPQHMVLLSYARNGYITYVTRGADIAILVTEMYLGGEYKSLYSDDIPRNGRKKVLARCYNTLEEN